ncbi:MAG: hypothetical protein AAFX94_14740 [Myxococcota bacterium]
MEPGLTDRRSTAGGKIQTQIGRMLTCALQPVSIDGHYRVTVQNQDGVSVLKDGIAEVQGDA